MADIAIEQIRPEHTRRLRQRVLYPHRQLPEMQPDEDANGMHFGAFMDNDLVSVVSLFKIGDDFRLRKFAVEPSVQKQGIGSKVLAYITEFMISEGGKRVWCNARVSAIPFYVKHGFARTAQTSVSNEGIKYEIMEKSLRRDI